MSNIIVREKNVTENTGLHIIGPLSESPLTGYISQ